MKRMQVITLALCLLSASALAQSRPLTDYAPGQMIDVGFARPVRFMAGCVLESGEGFMFVDAESSGGYLMNATGRIARDSISVCMPVPEGCSAEVTAEDEHGCVVHVHDGKESHAYTFAFEKVGRYEEPWKLRAYEKKSVGKDFYVQLSHDRMQAVERTAAGETHYTTFVQFFVEANNINYDKLPGSIEELKRLEKEYPVAAVSPSDPKSRVNLRKGPSTKTERVGSLYSGTRLHIREMQDGWAKIYVGDMDAYISTDFLTFGAAIEQVPDGRPSARLKDEEWVEISRKPYRGGGGTVSRVSGGQDVRIIGEYNSQWRIVGADGGSYFIDAKNLK